MNAISCCVEIMKKNWQPISLSTFLFNSSDIKNIWYKKSYILLKYISIQKLGEKPSASPLLERHDIFAVVTHSRLKSESLLSIYQIWNALTEYFFSVGQQKNQRRTFPYNAID